MDAKKKVRDAVEAAQAGSKAQDKVENAVARAAAEAISEARRTDKKTPARNTEEFIIKYAQKRFSPSTAGRAYLLSFLLDAYSMSERGVQTTLWNMDLLKSKVHSEEDIQSFDAYYYLTEWLRILFEDSRTMRNALRSVLSDFLHITTSILSAENIRRCIIGTPITDKLQAVPAEDFTEELNSNPDTLLTLWLNTLTLEAYTPQADGGTLLQSLRENIGEGLRYMVAYHTFLDVIADITGIPECAYLKIRMKPITETLEALNEALEALRDDIKNHREPEIRNSTAARPESFTFTETKLSPPLHGKLLPASLTFWTPEYLEATMRNFQPIGEERPVPEERVQFLRDSIRRDFKREYINWYVLYTRYSSSYRIPVPAVTPPTGRKGEKIRIKVEAQAEEGK